jgi:multidrug efflux pump subunit AcrA (membrane-fusion protein)
MQDAQRQTLDAVRKVSQQLLETSASPNEFFRLLLPRVVDDAGLQAAAVWLYDDHQRLRLVAEHELGSLSSTGEFFVDREHQAAVGDVMERVQVRILPHRTESEGESREHSLAIGPIVRDERGIGAIEVFAASGEDDDDQGPDFLQHLMDLLAGFGSKAVARSSPEPDGTSLPTVAAAQTSGGDLIDWRQFDRFVLGLQRLDVRQVAAAAVNDGRMLLGCDRLGLALREGGRIRIRAVSGQENIHQRANLVRSMSLLAERVMQSGERLVFHGSAEGVPGPLEKPLADYVAESRMRMVALLPLVDRRKPESADDGLEDESRRRARKAVGCLIVEQATESEPRRGVIARAELIAPHVASALVDAEQHESIFLLPAWRAIGRTLRWFRGRRLLAAVAIAIAFAAVGIGLAVVPWEYRVEGSGRLMPVIQHEIFAPEDGEVIELRVKGGETVDVGDPLLEMRNDLLQAEVIATRSEIATKARHAAALRIQSDDAAAKGSTEEAIRLHGEETRTRAELDGLAEKLKVLEKRSERLTVRSPARGTVATFQVEQLLRDRPVERGEKLLEVMDESGEWRLELEVPEHRMGHLLAAIHDAPNRTLRAEYVLATAVEQTFVGEVRESEIATRSNQSREEGAIVEVHAGIDARELPGRRIGAEVTAKIDCGERSLFYVLFGDVVEFVQRHVWW